MYEQLKRKFPLGHQFVKFSAVGAANTILDFAIYIGLTRSFEIMRHYFLGANLIAFAIATTSSFFLNKYFTFKNNGSDLIRQYIRFWSVALVYICLVQCILYIGVALFELHDVMAKIVATAIGTFWNFFAHKYWSFRHEHGTIEAEED